MLRSVQRMLVASSAVLLPACVAAQESSPARDPSARQKLDRVVHDNDALSKRLDATASAIREQCELSAGDCRVLVSERRSALLGGMTSSSCIGPEDSPAYVRCMANTLAERGDSRAAVEYFAFDNWCMKKELACTAELEVKAADQRRKDVAAQRRDDLARMAENVEAENLAAAGVDKVGYLRLALPPDAQGLCSDDDRVTSCLKQAEAQIHELDEQLSRDQNSYDKKQASELFRRARKQEASCYAIELGCLVDGLGPRYGIYPESKKWVDRNFALLEQRRALANKLPLDVADGCLNDAEAARQDEIVGAYQQYSNDTVLFFTVRLHKTFATLHEDQIRCLQTHLAAKSAAK